MLMPSLILTLGERLELSDTLAGEEVLVEPLY